MRVIIETEKGFVNAEWRKGRHYPEWFQAHQTNAQTFTMDHAETLIQLLDNNGIDVKRTIYVTK